MSLSLFGAPKDTVLKGTHSMNNDLMIKLHSDVSPHKASVEYVVAERGWDYIWKESRKIPFLESVNSSIETIKEYITNNWSDGGGKGRKFLPDDTEIEVLTSGPKTKLPNDIVFGIMSVGDIQTSLPKPTLSLYYHLWDIVQEIYTLSFEDINEEKTIVVNDGELTYMCDIKPPLDANTHRLYKFNIDKSQLILSSTHGIKKHTIEDFHDIIDMDVYMKLSQATKYFTPSGYKSLLQKLVRVRPTMLEIADEDGFKTIDAVQAAYSCFLLLYFHQGSFVPDLQRFVRGKESALKRLAVSIVEDGYVEDFSRITDLLGHALISQFVKDFNPSLDKMKGWLALFKESMSTSKYYKYDCRRDTKRMTKPTGDNLAAYLLQSIGSFQTDINMIYHLEGWIDDEYCKDTTMSIWHCIDQHWQPNMGYLFDQEIIKQICHDDYSRSQPLSNLMHFIWDWSSKYNSRKNDTFFILESDETAIIKDVQLVMYLYSMKLYNLLYYQSMVSSQLGRVVDENDVISKVYTLPESHVASKVGVMYASVDKGLSAMMCVNASNISLISVSKKPSRVNMDATLTPCQEDLAIAKAKEVLKKGTNGVKATWNDDHEATYTINGCTLDTWLTRNMEAKLFKYQKEEQDPCNNTRIYLSCGDSGKKIVHASETLTLDEFAEEDINRARYYVSIADDLIVFPSISRDGGNIVMADVGAYKIINKIAVYFPYIITQDAKAIGSFTVHSLYLLGKLMKSNEDTLCISDPRPPTMDVLYDRKNRIPYAYQTETVEELLHKKNNFIWIPVGMGKTFIISSYIAKLYEDQLLPSYVLYTMPKAAFKTVSVELKHWGYTTNTISPIGKKKWSVNPFCNNYTVNLIEHDHLRLIEQELERHISDTLFIVDEVHKTLAETQRSNAALTLASLSRRFVVLTGTPTINTNMSLLINWLKMTIDFPINKNNFWIAISSMISKQVNTGKKVIEEEVFVEMSECVTQAFNDLVSRSIGGNNDKMLDSDLRRAFEIAYDVVDPVIVDLTLENVDDGVFIVARNQEHQLKLKRMIQAKLNIEVGIINKDNVYNLVEPQDPGPAIVITTTRMSEGYTMTKMGVMITSVYFTNHATRTQLKGRINRVSQVRDELKEYTVLTRLLDLVHANYKYVTSVAGIMKMLV